MATERSSRLRTGTYVFGFNDKGVIDDTNESCFIKWELMKPRQIIYSFAGKKKQGSSCRGKTKSRVACL